MATKVSASRLMVRNAAHHLDNKSSSATVHCSMAKLFVTDNCFEVFFYNLHRKTRWEKQKSFYFLFLNPRSVTKPCKCMEGTDTWKTIQCNSSLETFVFTKSSKGLMRWWEWLFQELFWDSNSLRIEKENENGQRKRKNKNPQISLFLFSFFLSFGTHTKKAKVKVKPFF